jgi:hypothetical protein
MMTKNEETALETVDNCIHVYTATDAGGRLGACSDCIAAALDAKDAEIAAAVEAEQKRIYEGLAKMESESPGAVSFFTNLTNLCLKASKP